MDWEASMRNLLEGMLLDASAEPTDLPLSLLKAITNNFSDGQEIGRGGFAIVYKGLLQNGTVAVKRLSQTVDIDEKKFIREVDSLMRIKHKNIVRFLGYCSDTQGKVWNLEGKNVMAEVRQRMLCFEYLPKGSLDQYITDASHGLEWKMRYQIIKGICEGLHYLHKKNILHLDLKPANILLNDNMVPKIADFGLSRCFDEKQSRAVMTSKLFGSPGYMAPEYFSKVITWKSDIYSLGVIILEILTGQKGYAAVENVLESWKTRFQTSQGDTWLEQVRVCTEIGIKCIDSNPANRPDIRCIIQNLDETEQKYGFIETDLCTSSATYVEKVSSELDVPNVPGGTKFDEIEINQLKKQIEQLQSDHQADVEKLVNLRWINACLRDDLRSHPSSEKQDHHDPDRGDDGLSAIELMRKSTSFRSSERANELVLGYGDPSGPEGLEPALLYKSVETDLDASSETYIEQLKRQMEQLQSNRFSDVEELVYLKWLNARLRHELRSHNSHPSYSWEKQEDHDSPNSSAEGDGEDVTRASNVASRKIKFVRNINKLISVHRSSNHSCEDETSAGQHGQI